MELWKDIPGYEGRYQISSNGNVRSLLKAIRLRHFVCGSGYEEVILKKNGDRKPKLIHRLVAEAFVPNPQGKREVNHKDGNKHNNDYRNLEWVTPSENIRHSYDVLSHKLTTKRVVCVETGEVFESITAAADSNGLHVQLIWKCCNGKQKTTGGFHWIYAD